jgi:hypothetical protein
VRRPQLPDHMVNHTKIGTVASATISLYSFRSRHEPVLSPCTQYMMIEDDDRIVSLISY